MAISYVGVWTNTAAAREATLAQIANGADVLIDNANEAAAGFFRAVSDGPGVIAFGSNERLTRATATRRARDSVAREARERNGAASGPVYPGAPPGCRVAAARLNSPLTVVA